jgi:hypothetical protein
VGGCFLDGGAGADFPLGEAGAGHHRIYFDQLEFMSQLGLMPS